MAAAGSTLELGGGGPGGGPSGGNMNGTSSLNLGGRAAQNSSSLNLG